VQFLQELRSIRLTCVGPWVVGGDFNLIYKVEDKNNQNVDRAMMGRFRRLLNELELVEIDLLGRQFTWSNEREAPTLVRLDRVFVTTDWDQLFPDCILHALASSISDHCPLLLGLRDSFMGKRRFHFESFWPKLDGFMEVVQQSWEQPIMAVCPLQRLADKLRRLAKNLQSWSHRKTGNIKRQLLAREIIHQLESAQDSRLLSSLEIWLRRQLKHHILGLSSLERTRARLRSGLRWLKEGDANTAYFQHHARYRKKKNFIASLKKEDRVFTDQKDKIEVVWDFYSNLLGSEGQRNFTFDLQSFHRSAVDLTELDRIIDEEEIWNTIKSMPSDKAPGPDGFTGRFYKMAWQIIKVDFMAAVNRLFQGDDSRLFLLNSAYITLLPKKVDVEEVKDFRPISLIHSFAKIITKLLANRLSGKLSQLVSPNQSAFVKGRYILDNFVLVQQMAQALPRQKEPRVLLKLDITKAFDSVSWPFLLEVLQHLGFGTRWCNLLAKLLRSSSTRVLVNGDPGELIYHQRGFRQGDPLSPMLFVCVMDVLNSIILKAESFGLLHPLLRRGIGQRISLYADDVVLFMHLVRSDLETVKQVLKVFGEASGLVTNLAKSSFTPICCNDQEVLTIQETLSRNLVNFPCKYLGLPLSIRKLSKRDLLPLVEKVADRLPGWKAALIHPAGRATLVKSVLSLFQFTTLLHFNAPNGSSKPLTRLGEVSSGKAAKISKEGTV
jgi:hypothetical protein